MAADTEMPGPWVGEPDTLDFEAHGLKCALRRGPVGNWCGYVGVPEGHILHRQPYSKPCEALRAALEERKQQPLGENPSCAVMLGILAGEVAPSPEVVFEVHGGITYSGDRPGGGGEDTSLWWFGFDCLHAGDLYPSKLRWDDRDGVYRDVAYARRECERLADQLVAVAAPTPPSEGKNENG